MGVGTSDAARDNAGRVAEAAASRREADAWAAGKTLSRRANVASRGREKRNIEVLEGGIGVRRWCAFGCEENECVARVGGLPEVFGTTHENGFVKAKKVKSSLDVNFDETLEGLLGPLNCKP